MVTEQELVQSALVRGMIDAVEEVAGVKGRDLVLRQAKLAEYIEEPPPLSEKELVPLAHYRAMQRALMEAFGKGSRVLLVYIGEATVRRSIDAMPGLFSSIMRFIPGGLKKQAIIRLVADQGTKASGVPVKVDFRKDRVIYSDPGCVFCEGYQTEEPICALTCGVLLAAAEFATGKRHKATEVKCKAAGDESCVFEITEP